MNKPAKTLNKVERVFHTWDKWESFHYGFYNSNPPEGISKKQAEQLYFELLSSTEQFGSVLEKIIVDWPNSCEHNLTNRTLNRIAWMGQAALAYKYNIPAHFRGGFNLLSPEQQHAANLTALKYINKWMVAKGYPELSLDEAQESTVKQSLY
jgi:hypothetical protein